jgi:DNA-binding CsgD family transcriptional regulator
MINIVVAKHLNVFFGKSARDLLCIVNENNLKILAIKSSLDVENFLATESNKKSGISAQQRKIINLTALGGTTQYVADTLGISRNNVRAELSRLYRKIKVKNKKEMLIYFLSNGFN